VPPPIEHVVVLALENRSFDHMLGFLPHPAADFEGLLRGGPYSNPGWTPSTTITATAQAKTVLPVCPDHSHDAAMEQLGLNARPVGSRPTNDGFVTSYERICQGLAPPQFGGLLGPIIQWLQNRNPPKAPAPGRGPLVMECQDPTHVPVISLLAAAFEVCTQWFCSVPGETWPNRNFMHAATSDGETDIDPRFYTNKTIFEVIEAAGQDWHIYYDDTPQVWAFINLWGTPERHAKWFEFNAFAGHCRAGTLPAYSFIEPNHKPGFHTVDGSLGLSNNQHPGNNTIGDNVYDAAPAVTPGDFTRAESLIASVYESLRANMALFERTILLVTYDEHGGLYDHVPPPTGVPNPGSDPTLLRKILRGIYHRKTQVFDFSVLGPRVPTLVISPYMEAGRVTTQVRDHASICSTLRALFAPDAAPLTPRDKWAPPFHLDLTLTSPRTDLPDLSTYVPATPTPAPTPTAALPAAVPDHYQPYVELADKVRRQLAARGVPEAAPVPGMPAMERAGHTTAAFSTQAARVRGS
jgi:phospholipase C